LPRPISSYKPNGRKRGRPKGFSPIKARQQRLSEMGREEQENAAVEKTAPAKYELVQVGTTEGVNYISQKLIEKKIPAFSLKKAVSTLIGCR
jgi:outer membrane receptor for monomeric catechols